ncbi:MAG TPA: hypothetical protein VGD89_14475 [Flavipsychrobacter sp.]
MLSLLKKHPLAKGIKKGKGGIKVGSFLKKMLVPIPGINPALTPGHGLVKFGGLFGKKRH